MKTPMTKFDNNKGLALFIALIFLFVSTLLGINGLRTSLLNEKMSLNNIQREQALEAAEAALLAGETFVQGNALGIINAVVTNGSISVEPSVNAAGQDCTAFNGGVCAPVEVWDVNAGNTSTSKYDHWRDITSDTRSNNVWSTAGRHRSLDDALKDEYGLVTAPKYIIEFMGYVGRAGNDGATACTAAGDLWQLDNWPYCTLDAAQFRVTALATSGNYDETRVMLQSTYVVN